MKVLLRRGLVLPVLLALALLAPAEARGHGLVTSTATLAARLAGVTVVDVRPEADYQAGHLPGSLHVDGQRLDPEKRSPTALGEQLGPLGIADQVEVVVVGGGRAGYGLDG